MEMRFQEARVVAAPVELTAIRHNIDTEAFRCSCGARMCFSCGWCSKVCKCQGNVQAVREAATGEF